MKICKTKKKIEFPVSNIKKTLAFTCDEKRKEKYMVAFLREIEIAKFARQRKENKTPSRILLERFCL